VFLQNSEILAIFGIYGIIFLKKIHRICPQHRGSGPPAPIHGSTDFIKRRSLASGSTSQIESNEPIFRLLISVVHHRSDGSGGWLRSGAASARARGGAARPSTRLIGVRVFLSYGCRFLMRFAPTGSQRPGERVYANLNRRRAATKPGTGGTAQPVLVDSEGDLR
jgi:hypothetical protein